MASKPLRINVIYDTDPSVPEQGAQYMHCRQCLDSVPYGESAMSWARQQLAITRDRRLQLWCTRCDCNIALIRFEEVN